MVDEGVDNGFAVLVHKILATHLHRRGVPKVDTAAGLYRLQETLSSEATHEKLYEYDKEKYLEGTSLCISRARSQLWYHQPPDRYRENRCYSQRG